MPISDSDFAELFNQVRAINSRVTGMERTQEVLVRAEARQIVDPFLDAVRADPVLGRIYLEVDGTKSQNEIAAALRTSPATVSRKLDALEKDWHLIVLKDRTKDGKLYERAPVERILNLSRRVTRALSKA